MKQWRVISILKDEGDAMHEFMSPEFIKGAFLDMPLDHGITIAVESVKPVGKIRRFMWWIFGEPEKGTGIISPPL